MYVHPNCKMKLFNSRSLEQAKERKEKEKEKKSENEEVETLAQPKSTVASNIIGQPTTGLVHVIHRYKQASEHKSMPLLQLVSDELVYALILEVKNENTKDFKDMLPIIGGFHTRRAYMATKKTLQLRLVLLNQAPRTKTERESITKEVCVYTSWHTNPWWGFWYPKLQMKNN